MILCAVLAGAAFLIAALLDLSESPQRTPVQDPRAQARGSLERP
jgi:hypothetical protein